MEILTNSKNLSLIIAFTIIFAFISTLPGEARAQEEIQDQTNPYVIVGRLIDPQGQPIVEAQISATLPDTEEPLSETESQEDGSWVLPLSEVPDENFRITVKNPRLRTQVFIFDAEQRAELKELRIYREPDLVLERQVNAGFWAATIIFIGVLLLIALERLHSTTAALAGLSAIFLVSYIGGLFSSDFFIFSFERGLTYINWEVIFLVMGMMIIIAIIEATGIFQWMAFQSYKLSAGRTWLLLIILIIVTAVASALLDNFTTMLLMTPISIQIGLALGINPLALIIPLILASNVGGISTLVGTPTNILIGAYANISFTDFLVNQTGGVIIALVVLTGYILFHYRKELVKRESSISPALYKKLEENARLEDPDSLIKAGIVFILVLVGFILGEQVHLNPAVPAMIGATALLIWLKPDVQQMIIAVDWTTLVFFMALFVVVGAIQEVGLLGYVASGMSRIIGDNLILGIFMVVFGVGTLSTVIANIPLAASMLPIVDFLSGTIPGANSKVLYYALSMGSAMGGNGTLVGGEANLVTAGITEQANTPITFKEFVKVGLPVTYLTLLVGFLWLVYRFAL